MQIALYRARRDGKWLDNAINLFSGLRGFCHAELVFPDGKSFSSTAQDRSVDSKGRPKKDGTRWKFIDYGMHPDRWALVRIDVTEKQVETMRQFANSELDARYDFLGCVRFVLPVAQSEARWFCSEVVVATLQSAGLYQHWPRPHNVSPNKLAELLGVKS